MTNKHETSILKTLEYLPEIFNVTELWFKIQDVCGTYNIEDNKNHYIISNRTLYKYLNKYCIKQPHGQWKRIT